MRWLRQASAASGARWRAAAAPTTSSTPRSRSSSRRSPNVAARTGATPADARRAVLVEIGGVEPLKERVREVRMGRILDETLRDVAYAWRGLRKAPGLHRRGAGHAGPRRRRQHRHLQRRQRAAGPAAAVPRSGAAGVRLGRSDRRGLSAGAALGPRAAGPRRSRVAVRRLRRHLGDDRRAHRRERPRAAAHRAA